MKQLNSKKTRFPRFDKILVIQPIAEVYGEGNERQLCQEIENFQLEINIPSSGVVNFIYFSFES